MPSEKTREFWGSYSLWAAKQAFIPNFVMGLITFYKPSALEAASKLMPKPLQVLLPTINVIIGCGIALTVKKCCCKNPREINTQSPSSEERGNAEQQIKKRVYLNASQALVLTGFYTILSVIENYAPEDIANAVGTPFILLCTPILLDKAIPGGIYGAVNSIATSASNAVKAVTSRCFGSFFRGSYDSDETVSLVDFGTNASKSDFEPLP